MVCIYCGGPTYVTNSRHQKRSNNIWRRRSCSDCGVVTTTQEKPDLSTSIVVQPENAQTPQPFIRDKLFLSIYASCQHRPAALQEASALTQTIIAKLKFQNGVSIDSKEIVSATLEVLKRFDPVAATVYRAYHPAD